MMLSGLGSAEHLSQHGLPVVHHLPGVGRGLMDHPLVPVTARVKKPRSTMQTNVHIWSNGAEVAYMFKADEQGQPTWDFRHDQPDIQINCEAGFWFITIFDYVAS